MEGTAPRNGHFQLCPRPNHVKHHKSAPCLILSLYLSMLPGTLYAKPPQSSPHSNLTLPVLPRISCYGHVYQLSSFFNDLPINFFLMTFQVLRIPVSIPPRFANIWHWPLPSGHRWHHVRVTCPWLSSCALGQRQPRRGKGKMRLELTIKSLAFLTLDGNHKRKCFEMCVCVCVHSFIVVKYA